MQTSANLINDIDDKVKHALGTFQDLIENQPDLKENLKKMFGDKQIFNRDEKYIKKEWDAVVRR